MSSADDTFREETIVALQKAYTMELESVVNYLAASTNLDGILAQQVRDALDEDVTEELGHAKRLAERIKQLGGQVPIISELDLNHSKFESTQMTIDLEAVVRSVLDDEYAAIDHYREIIQHTEGRDYVTQDLCIALMADEEEHRRLFEGFLKEFAHV